MTTLRPLPWTDLLEAVGEQRLADIREAARAARAARADPARVDAVLLLGPAGALLKELMPPDAPPEALTEYASLLHVLFLHWDGGQRVRALDRPALERALADLAPLARPPAAPGVTYVQLPERAVWAEPAPGTPHEPLDGCFVALTASQVRVLAVLGFRPERGGFTSMEAAAPLPLLPPGPRPDGSAPFASTLPAGERMGFRSVVSPAELLALGFLSAGLPA